MGYYVTHHTKMIHVSFSEEMIQALESSQEEGWGSIVWPAPYKQAGSVGH